MAQFRFVHIHASHPDEGDWLTLQRDDYFPLRWHQVKDHRDELEARIAKETMTMGGIGDAYSEWKDWALLPEWAIKPLECEPIT